MRDILIGIDAGTSVIKSVAFDLGGRQLAMTAVPNSYEAVAAPAAFRSCGVPGRTQSKPWSSSRPGSRTSLAVLPPSR